MVKVLWYSFAMDSIPLLQKNKETNYYKISFWTCLMCDTLDASMNVSLHGIELEQNVLKSYPKDSLMEWLEEVPSFSLHFIIFVWKVKKLVNSLLCETWHIIKVGHQHQKTKKKYLTYHKERYVDLSKKNHVKNFKTNQSIKVINKLNKLNVYMQQPTIC